MTDILNDKDIRAIPQASRQAHLGTCPLTVMLIHSQVEKAVLIGPRIRGIASVGLPASVGRRVTYSPVITTKMDDLREDRRHRLAWGSSDGDHAVALRRERRKLGCGVKPGFN